VKYAIKIVAKIVAVSYFTEIALTDFVWNVLMTEKLILKKR